MARRCNGARPADGLRRTVAIPPKRERHGALRNGRLPGLVALAFVALAAPSLARVFWSQRIGPETALDGFPGWSRTYEAPVRVNGAEGVVETWSCDETFEVVCARLNALAGGPEKTGAGDRTILVRTLFTETRVSRMIALDFGRDRPCAVIALHQKRKDYESMLDGTGKRTVTDLPPHPGGQVRLAVENLDTRTGLDVVGIPAVPSDVLGWADAALSGAGWSRPDAGGGMFGGSRFRLYSRGGALLFIQVSGGAHERDSTLLVLQKN